ncbi:MAG: HAMP domain-containing histidine kinase [bacterium]|nr:HAMP domain-containing histidine kinase [bacterium]
MLIALFTALLIVLVNLAGWFYYQKTEELLDHQLGRRLTAIAQAATVALNPGRTELLAAGGIESYLEAAADLEILRLSDSLSEVFIINENYRYLATTALESDSMYFAAGLHAALIDSLFYSGDHRVLLSPIYRSGSLYLRSAFAPLPGPEGFVLAVLGVEANVDYSDALAELRRNLYYSTGMSLAGGLILGLLFLLLQRRINRAEQQLFLGATHAHLGRMVAVVAHEMRNPLMIIRGSAERIGRKTGMPEAESVVEEIDRLNGIVTGYLDFARSGGSLLSGDEPGDISLEELISEVRRHLFEKFGKDEIFWLEEPSQSSLTFRSHPGSLRQVLLNLLLNGVESCRAAGRKAEVGIYPRVEDSWLTLVVVDHGPGLTRKELRKIFMPFYTTRQSGSGLGLYLSRKIVIEMGGTMEVRSEPDVSTEIVIRLPLEPKA